MADEIENLQNAEAVSTYQFQTKKRLVSGIFIVIGISFSWVGSSQFTEDTYTKSFNAPSFMMWFSTSWMMLSYLPVIVTSFAKRRSVVATYRLNAEELFGPDGTSPKALFKMVMPFCLIWSATNYCYTRAIGKMVVTDVTAIFSSCNAFVYLFSLLILHEPFLAIRVLSVVLSMAGVVIMAYADGFQGPTIEGIVLSLLSAIGAAIYKVMFKRVFGNARVNQVALFLSLLGFLNFLFLWPLFEILYYTKEELIIWTGIPWDFLCGRSFLGLLFNFLINFGIAFTFPLFISLGTIVGIPLNGLIDNIFRNESFGKLKIGATFLIIFGFLLMLLPANVLRRFKRTSSKSLHKEPFLSSVN